MHTIDFSQVIDGLQNALRDGNVGLAEEILWPALDQRPDYPILWFYGGALLSMKGLHVLAKECFQKSYDLEPHTAIWSNIGACLRQAQDVTGCRKVLEIGLEHAPDEPHILANLCGSYVNEGNPEPGIAYGERVADNPEAGPACKFNLALLHLESGNYGRGFDLYAQGEHKLRELRTYDPDPPELTPELHAQLKGQGKKLIVYGEQGLGDEIMFATMLMEAKKDYEIVLDHHPRLAWLFKNSSWFESEGHPITMFPTRKKADKGWSVEASAKIAIGNLGQFYRREKSAFKWDGPVYKAPEDKRAEYRAHLEKIAKGRKIIGLATRGGTMQTTRLYRMIPGKMLELLISDDRYLFVCLDYEDMTPMAEYTAQRFGPGKYVWHPSLVWHYDYEHTAALVAATDAVVTITQTVAHLSAAMGHPTYILTPSRPDWRMGLKGETWDWYPHPNARLLRQQGDDWSPAVLTLTAALEARFFDGKTTNPMCAHERKLMDGVNGASICELGSKQFGRYKRYFEQEGLKHVSIDLNGKGGSIALDLTQPINGAEIGGPFDIVTNFGTTEHVPQQEPCWRNVLELLNTGGTLISCTPYPGEWPGHGHWYPTEEWYRQFCELNGLEIQSLTVEETDMPNRRMVCLRAIRNSREDFVMPSVPIHEMRGGKVGAYV